MTQAEWFAKLDTVELENPGQAESAAYITAKFASGAGDHGPIGNGTDSNATTLVAVPCNPRFPRTPKEMMDCDRQMTLYQIHVKLLNTVAVPYLERAKYLARRLNVLPVVGALLEDTPENNEGWKAMNLDPDEEGASALVRRMEEYALKYMASANISHDENWPPLYLHEHSDFSIHSMSAAYAMTVNKVFPDKFSQYGASLNMKAHWGSHPVNPTDMWEHFEEEVEIPSSVPFKNESKCGGKPMTIAVTIYPGYGKQAPLRRNPT